jgi:hypothetical protein
MKRSDLTPKAMAHLHGKCLMDILTPCEESFVWLLIVLDIIRYHSESLGPALAKYASLFSKEDEQAVDKFITSYTKGIEKVPPFPFSRKPFKGYHSNNIYLFVIIKKQVLEESKNVNSVMSYMERHSENGPTTGAIPFTFNFPKSNASIKLESDDSFLTRNKSSIFLLI